MVHLPIGWSPVAIGWLNWQLDGFLLHLCVHLELRIGIQTVISAIGLLLLVIRWLYSFLYHLYCVFYVPCLVRVRPLRHFHQAVCKPCMYLSLYVPCLVRVRPHFRHFHQAVHMHNTCLALLFIVFLHHCILFPINVGSLYLNLLLIEGDWIGGGHKTFC